MKKPLFIGILSLVFLCFTVGQSNACPLLRAVITPPEQQWAHQGYDIAFCGNTSIGSIVDCNWSLPSEAYDIMYYTEVYPNDVVICKFNTIGTYTVTLTVTDSEERTDSDTCTVNVVAVDMVPGTHYVTQQPPPPNVYIAYNYDDDDSDVVPDNYQTGTVAGEDDLLEIQLSVAPTDLPGEVKLRVFRDDFGYYTCFKVWSDPDKQNLIIPNGSPLRYHESWSPSELPAKLYVEGYNATAIRGVCLDLYYVAPEWGPVSPSDRCEYTVVEVDVDMDGVKDDDNTYPGVTQEIMPGGFIPLNELVKITLKKVVPLDLTGNVTLKKVPSDSTKIKIWENENKTGSPISLPATYTTPTDLPKELWVEGIELSSSARDITIVLEYSIDGKTFDDRIKVTVYSLEVDWETYLDNTEIDEVSEGLWRIFTGKKTYDDTSAADRKKVRVKATITPAIDNKKIYFSWWDVDDPSTDDPPIDTNGSTGNDNRGSGENLSTTQAVTNGSGEARVTFTVAMQPGDNYKIAASINQTKLNEMTQAMADGQEGLPDTVVLSDMLTTWRKLHVERDSMEEVATTGPEKNRVTGTADSYDYNEETDETTIDLGQDLADCWEETKPYHFVGGDYIPDGGSTYDPIKTISHMWPVDDELIVDKDCSAESKVYVLVDDDKATLPEIPDTSKMNSIFEDCYILCVNDARGSSNNVAFKRHVGGATTGAGDIEAVAQRGSAPDEASNWWVVYILMTYQPGYSQDDDPSFQPGVKAAGTEQNHWQASVLFLETIRDTSLESYRVILKQQLVVHEIGHQVLEHDVHTPNTIMATAFPVDAQYEKFSPTDIATIRSQSSSPGD